MIKHMRSLFMRQHLRFLSCTLMLAVMSGGAQQAAAQAVRKPAWAVPVKKSSNLYRVTPQFFRSAQLVRGDIALLRSLGIKTVVSLRAFHSDAELLKDTDIKMIQIPIYTWDIDDRQVIDALRAIKAAQRNGPVLLHCQHGADRTGLITAMYRILYQHWTKDKALDELMHGDYGYHTLWKNIVRYVRRVDIEKIRQRVERE